MFFGVPSVTEIQSVCAHRPSCRKATGLLAQISPPSFGADVGKGLPIKKTVSLSAELRRAAAHAEGIQASWPRKV